MSVELQAAYQSFNLEFLVDKAGIFKTTGHKGMSGGRHVVQELPYLLFFCEVSL